MAARKTIPRQSQPKQSVSSANDLLAPGVLGLGSLAWKGLSYLEHIDFLLSVKEERAAMIFEFFENTGWWLLIIAAFFWWFVRRGHAQETPMPNWELLASSSVISFLFGVLIAVKSAGGVPTVITGWGSPDPTKCVAVFDTSKLKSFKGEYKMAFVCGITDPTTDRMDENRITVSNSFTITDGAIVISAPIRQIMSSYINSTSSTVPVQIWYDPILLPKDVKPDKISNLSDVLRVGGKILRPQLFN